MNDSYIFSYSKRGIFWRKLEAVGHKFDEGSDRMDIFLKPTGIVSIPNWMGNFWLKLGDDWHRMQEQQMSEEAQKEIKTNRH